MPNARCLLQVFGDYYYLTNAHENVVHQELSWQNHPDCLSFPAQTPSDAVAIVCL